MQLTRVNRLGLKFLLSEIDENQTRISLGSKSIVVNLDIKDLNQAWYNWQVRGDYIQDAFKELKADEREFILSGIDSESWDNMFKKGEN